MSKQKPATSSSSIDSNIGVLIKSLRLLDFDELDDWSSISAQHLASRDAGPNQKRRVENVEWILYHLFNAWDGEQTLDKLRPFFPAFEPIQSLNLRAALFRWLNQLKTDGVLGKDVTLRKTMFDDCKGDRFIEMITIFSTIVLRKVLSGRQDGKGTTARQICIKANVTSMPQSSHVALTLAHQHGLRQIVAQKKESKQRYDGFDSALNMKDKEVDRRFGKVVETQDFLDQNIAPEATVARITKQFEDHWQADGRYIKAVTQGEVIATHDAFLDRPFHETWSDVSNGTYAPDFSLSRTGILEDLENRVAVQAVRLHEWKKYRSDLQKKSRSTPKHDSPVRTHEILSPKDRAAEKELVFSPRKSPRKSILPVRASPISTPIKSSPSFMYRRDSPTSPLDAPHSPLNDMKAFLKRRQSHVKPALGGTPDTDHNDSGFSEISDNDLTTRLDMSISKVDQVGSRADNTIEEPTRNTLNRLDSDGFAIPQPRLASSKTGSFSREEMPAMQPSVINDEAQRANAILAATFNAAPTPSKPPLTLEERTRQSLALTSSSSRLATAQSSQPKQSRPSQATTIVPSLPEEGMEPPPLPRLNLAERTRQSISIAQLNKPKPQLRKSLAGSRRDSARIFPINQFETPGKGRRESGFDERAGYDSVFKSRPKVVVSPQGTPVEEIEGEEEDHGAGLGIGMESPLGRMGVV